MPPADEHASAKEINIMITDAQRRFVLVP
jgi:hypothetical protein